MGASYSQRPEKGIASPGTGVTAALCWGSNPGPLEGEPVLLVTESPLQPSDLEVLGQLGGASLQSQHSKAEMQVEAGRSL